MARKNLIEDIYQDLRTRILTDVLSPGQKISESALAAEYDCSRTPIRETLKRLEDDGLLLIKPKSGTYVQHETTQDFIELMQVRTALERLAFLLAIERINDEGILQLEKYITALDDLVTDTPIDMMRFARIHYEFHYCLVSLSGNSFLLRQFERLNLRSSHMFYQMMDHDLAKDTQGEHWEIIRLLKEGDTAGSQFIENHLSRKIHRYLQLKKMGVHRNPTPPSD